VVLDRLPEDRRGHRRRHAVRAIAQSVLVAALLFAAFFLLPLNGAEAIGEVLTLVGGVLLVTLTLVWQIRKILVAPYPAVRAVSTLVVSIPLFLVVFATLYFLMGAADARQFSEPLNRMDALYYTVTVFATVGFGDITAVSQSARAVTTIQMLAGLILVGVIARVVFGAVQVNWHRSAQEDPPE
jgi:voltage-gated potassium channel